MNAETEKTLVPFIGNDVDDFKRELKAIVKRYSFEKYIVDAYNGHEKHIGRFIYLAKGDSISYQRTLNEIIHEVFGEIGIA